MMASRGESNLPAEPKRVEPRNHGHGEGFVPISTSTSQNQGIGCWKKVKSFWKVVRPLKTVRLVLCDGPGSEGPSKTVIKGSKPPYKAVDDQTGSTEYSSPRSQAV